MTLTIVLILIISGVVVGFINTLSAGGTTISIALYLALGLPATTTNAINRVGVLIQNGFASCIFYKKHLIDYKQILLISIPIALGTLVGSLLAVKINQEIFNICFAIILLLMIVFLFIDTKKQNHQRKSLTFKRYILYFPIFLIIGFYGGFVQAGTGFLLISTISFLFGYDLISTTAAKNTLMFLYTLVAITIFFFQAKIEFTYWLYGLVHSSGNIIGSFIAAKYALKMGAFFVKIIIVAVIILTCLNLVGVLNMSLFFEKIVK